MRILVEIARPQADLGQGFGGALAAFGRRHAAQRLGHRPAHAAPRVERAIGVLEDHLDMPAQAAQRLPRQGVGVLAQQLHRPAGRPVEPDRHAREGGLAAARFADHAEIAPAHHREAYAVQRIDVLGRLEQALARQAVVARQRRGLKHRAHGVTLKQRAWWPWPRSTTGGTSAQSATASVQRSAKRQPGGRSASSGTVPAMVGR